MSKTVLFNADDWGLSRRIHEAIPNSADEVADAADAAGKLRDGFHEFYFHPGRDKKLTGIGTDEATLLRLADILPRSARIPADVLKPQFNNAALPRPPPRHEETIQSISTVRISRADLP